MFPIQHYNTLQTWLQHINFDGEPIHYFTVLFSWSNTTWQIQFLLTMRIKFSDNCFYDRSFRRYMSSTHRHFKLYTHNPSRFVLITSPLNNKNTTSTADWVYASLCPSVHRVSVGRADVLHCCQTTGAVSSPQLEHPLHLSHEIPDQPILAQLWRGTSRLSVKSLMPQDSVNALTCSTLAPRRENGSVLCKRRRSTETTSHSHATCTRHDAWWRHDANITRDSTEVLVAENVQLWRFGGNFPSSGEEGGTLASLMGTRALRIWLWRHGVRASWTLATLEGGVRGARNSSVWRHEGEVGRPALAEYYWHRTESDGDERWRRQLVIKVRFQPGNQNLSVENIFFFKVNVTYLMHTLQTAILCTLTAVISH